MMGGLWAGTEEAAGTTVMRDGKKYKQVGSRCSQRRPSPGLPPAWHAWQHASLSLCLPFLAACLPFLAACRPLSLPPRLVPSPTSHPSTPAHAETTASQPPIFGTPSQFYGMSSSTAMKKHAGGVAEYRSSEGKTVEVPHKGPVMPIILDMLGGLRSACTYIGATTIKGTEITAEGLGAAALRAREHRIPLHIDLSDLDPEQRIIKAAAFFAGLMSTPSDLWSNTMLVCIDEGHLLAPHLAGRARGWCCALCRPQPCAPAGTRSWPATRPCGPAP